MDINLNLPDQRLIARVAVENAAYSFDALFDYIVSNKLKEAVQPGMRVIVPFGKGGRKLVGMIFELAEIPNETQFTYATGNNRFTSSDKTAYLKENQDKPSNTANSRLKYIDGLIDDAPALNSEQLELALWLHSNTFCTYFDAVKSILPTGLGIVINSSYSYKKPSSDETFTEIEKSAIDTMGNIKSHKDMCKFISFLENTDKQTFRTLLNKGIIIKEESVKQKVGADTVRMVRLCERDALEEKYGSPFTPKQRSVIELLSECKSASVKEICYNAAVSAAVVKNLVQKGWLIEYEYTVSRSEPENVKAVRNADDIIFSNAQQTVFDGLKALLDSGKSSCALLRGVTASGKTSIFIKLIEHSIKRGKTALLLVPEIALTPQMTENFTAFFGGKVAIIHSGLSLGQRADEYIRIRDNKAKIVIGTRSAVFSPLENIGIIVIDEEGEHTYKSDASPRYHARDIAKQRVCHHNALLLLASATPSLESYHFAKTGRYHLFELEERYSKAILPDVYIVDMKIEAELGNRSNFSEALLGEITANLACGEQTMILLNRRGYHTYANCISCGEVLRCPNCEIPLTYHKTNNTIQCHYCGFNILMPDKCAKCGSKFIRQSGTGTQRIEEELSCIFPSARILRMDADTTMTKYAHEKKFKSFANGDFDIMIGTQMIAKGLDFENVTLVGVLLIDKALYAGDYMGYERTFSLVTQVVGRCGRGDKKGRAYLQTYTPDHYVLELAAAQNYKEFYNQEIDIRRALIFPPFCDIFLIGFASADEEKAVLAAKRFIEIFKDAFTGQKMPIRVLGPAKSAARRINGKYRQKIIIKAKNTKEFRLIIERAVKTAYKDAAFKGVSFYVDINGDIY